MRFVRTEMVLGQEAVKRLASARVAVFGIGGVGSFAAEALARAGIGRLDFVDNDVVSESNINRQLVATTETIGRYKAEIMRERALAINPAAQVRALNLFYTPETPFDFSGYDFVVDAIDTVSSKIDLIVRAQAAGAQVISSMGTGNKLDPTRFEVTDIYKTTVCPLARVMRRELKARGVTALKVVYSREEARKPFFDAPDSKTRRATPGSVPFVPPVAGMILAGEVIKSICGVD